VLQSSLLIGFTGLGFFIMRNKLKPEAKINLDFDYFYRLVGRLVLAIARRPIEVIDVWWSEIYRVGGLKNMLRIAAGSAWFDKAAIDGVVDGSAYTVQKIGRVTAMSQTGRLQEYLGAALIVGLTVFALIWFL
jgi:multicomponent Na+:H+ antiporter subunit D